MSKLKVGDRIVFGRGKRNRELLDTTIGKVYKLVDADGYGDVAYIDDAGDRNFSAGKNCVGKPTKIVD
jgi:hypothetical protein